MAQSKAEGDWRQRCRQCPRNLPLENKCAALGGENRHHRAGGYFRKEVVRFGKESEAAIRQLFQLDFPEYQVSYDEFGMIANEPDCPFIFATLDGELTDSSGRKGILEIKTTEIRRFVDWKSGTDRYPTITMHRLSINCLPQGMNLQSSKLVFGNVESMAER